MLETNSLIVPGLLDDVLKESLVDSLSSVGSVNATILDIVPGEEIGGSRRLQEFSWNVTFTLELIQECYRSDCDQVAVALLDGMNQTVASSIADGTLSQEIQERGTDLGIDIIARASVVTDSYTSTGSTITLEEPEIVINPEPVQTSGSSMLSIPLVTFALIMLA
jgi:hypothetical protein